MVESTTPPQSSFFGSPTIYPAPWCVCVCARVCDAPSTVVHTVHGASRNFRSVRPVSEAATHLP